MDVNGIQLSSIAFVMLWISFICNAFILSGWDDITVGVVGEITDVTVLIVLEETR